MLVSVVADGRNPVQTDPNLGRRGAIVTHRGEERYEVFVQRSCDGWVVLSRYNRRY